jgi:DNA polymerase-3 subunit epsilon
MGDAMEAEAKAGQPLTAVDFTVLDLETTGGAPPEHRVTEIAAYRISGLQIGAEFNQLVNPERDIPPFITNLTGISQEMVSDMPACAEVLPELLEFIGDSVIVAHHSQFDRRFLDNELQLAGHAPLRNADLCTNRLARRMLPWLPSKGLGNLALFFGIGITDRHRAAADALATSKLLLLLFEYLATRGISTIEEVLLFQFGEYDYQD